MKKNRILSQLRIELRRRHITYPAEKIILHWNRNFMETLSITDSSQIRGWHKKFYLSGLKKRRVPKEEIRQAEWSLHFLYDGVMRQEPGFVYRPHFLSGILQKDGKSF